MPVRPKSVKSTSGMTRSSRPLSVYVCLDTGVPSHIVTWRLTGFDLSLLLKRKRSVRYCEPFAPSTWPTAGRTRTTDALRSGGKNVGSFVRLSTANTVVTASPRAGCTTSAAFMSAGMLNASFTKLTCCCPSSGASTLPCRVALSGSHAVTAAATARPETSASARFVR